MSCHQGVNLCKVISLREWAIHSQHFQHVRERIPRSCEGPGVPCSTHTSYFCYVSPFILSSGSIEFSFLFYFPYLLGSFTFNIFSRNAYIFLNACLTYLHLKLITISFQLPTDTRSLRTLESNHLLLSYVILSSTFLPLCFSTFATWPSCCCCIGQIP